MNKRFSFLILLAYLFVIPGQSNPIDVYTAQKLADTFFQKNTAYPLKVQSLSTSELELAFTETGKDRQNCYYVFNRIDGNGFIVVSGDDKVGTILGYADEGRFNTNNVPENFQYWLDACRTRIENLPESQAEAAPREDGEPVSVAPLLGNISYDQNTPYNNLCPSYREGLNLVKTVTGCAATSMAQIMRYYKYPEHGIGSHTYRTSTRKLSVSADFENTYYDWDNMLETYETGKFTDEEAEAIATLMFHCGVAMNMDYDVSSGTTDEAEFRAFVNYFDYDASTIRLHRRDFYTSSQWKAMVKDEIVAGRPVVYNGQSVGGGHSFVCDGYDENGLYHINWGWGGLSNGYFDLDVLDPGLQGTGGGIAGFSFLQSIITGIQPRKGDVGEAVCRLEALGMGADQDKISGNGVALMIIYLLNSGIGDFEGNVGICLQSDTDENDRRYLDFGETSVSSNLNSVFGRVASSDFPDGTYRMYPAFKPLRSDVWEIMPMPQFWPEYLLAITENGTTTLDDENVPQSMPEVTQFKISDKLVKGEEAAFEITVKNNGKELNQAIAVIFQEKTSFRPESYLMWMEGVYLSDGESKTLNFAGTIDLEEGDYYAYAGIYTQLGIAPFEETITEAKVLSSNSSVQEVESEDRETNVYPNPVGSNLYIRTNSPITGIRLVNLSGSCIRVIHPDAACSAVADMGALPAGTYYIQIDTDEERIVRKLIKQ